MRQISLQPLCFFNASAITVREKEKMKSTNEREAKLVEIKMKRNDSPPIGDFELKLFNFFVLNQKAIYYYFDSSFTSLNEFDKISSWKYEATVCLFTERV